jgi:hypothetical protein
MSGSDFRLTESTRAIFTCERGTVQFYFVDFDKQVGKRFLYTLEEAADLGEQIVKTGAWAELPVSGISTSELRTFGERLRDYGISGLNVGDSRVKRPRINAHFSVRAS